MKTLLTAFLIVLGLVPPARAQVGALLWEEDFDDLTNWILETGNGSWGWGNGELQYYSPNNVDVVEIPGEPGNNAVRITARQESGPGITDQWGNPLDHTSGRMVSKSKVSVRYGLIEVRMQVPDLDLGGWPAFWMLGTSNLAWPRRGELDLMEMGSTQAFRDLHDTHNGGNGLDDSTVNEVVGANAIFYSDAAVNPGNPSGAASLSYDPNDVSVRPYYEYDRGLVERFLTYRLYWDEDSLRFTVVDDGVEHDLYAAPFTIDAESAEFREPFHFVTNLAIGGAFTDAWNLGDPGSGAPVSMPLPAEMLIDSIRVYEWNGQGEVHLGPPDLQAGTFGLFTDTTPVADGITPGLDAGIYVWEGTLEDGTILPYEGPNGISWRTTGKGWFGAGILSNQPINLFEFGGGSLDFRIKIPANVSFEIGIIDAWGNQSWVVFPAFTTTYGLQRDGEWGQASIPVADIRGAAIDLRMMSYSFAILERQGVACEFAIDDVYWTDGVATAVEGATPAPRMSVQANAPNPFNARTSIRFTLTEGGPYAITVFDVAGRVVKTFRGIARGGENLIAWDGRDDEGVEVASGVYTYRVDAAGTSVTRKMAMVK